MEILLLAGFAFFIAALVSAVELISSKFPRTASFLLKNSQLYIYAGIYGLFAFMVMLVLDKLIQNQSVTFTGVLGSSPWLRAFAVGLTIKTLMHLNLITVTSGTKATPIGLETILYFFEPELLRMMTYNEFLALRDYLNVRATKYSDLSSVKAKMKDNIPPTLPSDERITFENALDKDDTVIRAMERFLRFVGRPVFDRIFPI